jgi:hypothetical protein
MKIGEELYLIVKSLIGKYLRNFFKMKIGEELYLSVKSLTSNIYAVFLK